MEIDRRSVLVILGGSLVLACKSSSDDASPADASSTDSCATIASETSGPYPDLDNMISNAAYERSSIAEDQTGTALKFTLSILDSGNACAPIAGALVMVWHCNKDGVYSEYSNSMNAGSTTTTFLRGWQTSDANGDVTFTTIYPGWYSPRATHIHVEVYNPSDLTTPIKTTQFGFPDDANTAVQSQSTYKSGQTNTTTNDTDQVFGGTVTATGDGDGGGDVNQVASVSGDVTAGYTAALDIGLTGYAA
ncbi:MAG TPA: hypothetical protein VGG28_27210 [Kofleriaceae bacterium]|jgi:protocatechuate 3,4-dioxygenase beta subunit